MAKVVRAIIWADVVHWCIDEYLLPWRLDMRLVAWLRKARIVEFMGTDIRIPRLAVQGNPYREQMYSEMPGSMEEREAHSLEIQRWFSNLGYSCASIGAELIRYLDPGLFPKVYRTWQRLVLSDFESQFPSYDIEKPIIAHMPSNRTTKGTSAVLKAINQLKKVFDFEFTLIHGVPHARAVEMLRECDILAAEFVAGEHGIAALEGMALGKPTVCFVTPQVRNLMPADLPIINATQDNLKDVLASLLAHPEKLHEIGVRSRKYVERHHDSKVVAQRLVNIYRDLLGQLSEQPAEKWPRLPLQPVPGSHSLDS